MAKVDPTQWGNPIVLTQATSSETWVTNGHSITIRQAIVDNVSADVTSAIVCARDDTSAAASDILHRDVRSGINTVLWPEPVTLSKLYIRNLAAGRIIMYLD
jgi:hypothetical protein